MEPSAFELAGYNLNWNDSTSWTLPGLNLTLPTLNTSKGINVLEKVLGQYNKRIESTDEMIKNSDGYKLIKDIEPEKSVMGTSLFTVN